MGVDDGAEVEGGGGLEGFRGEEFEGAVVAGGEEGQGVEGVEGGVGDA